MKCPLCNEEAVILKKQILQYSVINFWQCINSSCSHKFITNIPTAPYPKKGSALNQDEKKDNGEKSSHFHFLK
jgi:hypothetical protein